MSSSVPSSFRGDEDSVGRPMYDGGACGNIMFSGNNNNNNNNNNTGGLLLGGIPSNASTQFFASHPYSQSGSAFQSQQQQPPSGASQYVGGGQHPSAMLLAQQRYTTSSRLSSMDAGGYAGVGSQNNHHLSNMAPAHSTTTSINNNNASSLYEYCGVGTSPPSTAMYGSSSDNPYTSDPHFNRQNTTSGPFGVESTVAASSDHPQQPFPTTLNDYYLGQQQLQQQYISPSQQLQQHQASFYGLMAPTAHPMACVPSSAYNADVRGMFKPSLKLDGSSSAPEILAPSTKPKKRRAKTFPEKLMKVFMDHNIASRDDQAAMAWLPDGKSFIVVNPDIFVKTVLNKGFKASKYASFVRKLHRWGFVRLTSGTGTDCFHHPLFALGDMEKVRQISCAPPSSIGGRGNAPAPKPPTLAGVERFIKAKVAEAASETFHETIDMRQSSPNTNSGETPYMMQHRETPEPTETLKVTARNKALENSTSNMSKDDIEWNKGFVPYHDHSQNPFGNYGAVSDYNLGKGAQRETGVPKESRSSDDLVVSPTGAFSPRPFPSNDNMVSKTSSGDPQHEGRFYNAIHEARPSGLDELAMVANGFRTQSLHASAAI